MAAETPVGVTFVDTLKKSFVDVPVDPATKAIDTETFLEATESLITIFDILGPTAFGLVKEDMLGNVAKIRKRQLEAPGVSETLQSLVVNELKTKKHNATEGLLWLFRGLEFMHTALSENIKSDTEELKTSFNGAYKETLSKHHNFVARTGFRIAMAACPYRKDFYAKLSPDYDVLKPKLKAWLAALENIVAILETFLDSKEAKW
ncbi:het-c [Sporothrix schenckii 1099-18]|nr:het-c [Sporothrix schenckii 1099-18]KJR88292.1 het-c [Sporothrix schenckii 1099-18]